MNRLYSRLLVVLVVALGCFKVAQAADVSSRSYLVMDADHGTVIWSRNSEQSRPIASLTKLMTAMVVLDAQLDMGELIEITEDDRDRLKWSRSRVPMGKQFTRADLLQLALMSSDNRAAHALARHYPGGVSEFVRHMNLKAAKLGLSDTQFVDPAGLDPRNVSTANDVAKMARAAYGYETIRDFSTAQSAMMDLGSRSGPSLFRNTNSLIREGVWPIELSKTGFIVEAGYCLSLVSRLMENRYVIVLLDAPSSRSRTVDASNLQARVTQALAQILPIAGNGKGAAQLLAMRRSDIIRR